MDGTTYSAGLRITYATPTIMCASYYAHLSPLRVRYCDTCNQNDINSLQGAEFTNVTAVQLSQIAYSENSGWYCHCLSLSDLPFVQLLPLKGQGGIFILSLLCTTSHRSRSVRACVGSIWGRGQTRVGCVNSQNTVWHDTLSSFNAIDTTIETYDIAVSFTALYSKVVSYSYSSHSKESLIHQFSC